MGIMRNDGSELNSMKPTCVSISHASNSNSTRFKSHCVFVDILLINKVGFTIRDAAFAAVYLENDNQWELCLTKANTFQMPYQLRQLFVTISVYSLPNNVMTLRSKSKDELLKDCKRMFNADSWDSDRQVHFWTMKCLDSGFRSNSKTLADFPEIEPELSIFADLNRGEATGNTMVEKERR